MTNDISIKQRQFDFWEVFLIICLAYTVVTILVIFFEEDLFRIFTPFLAPFILLFVFLVYLVLAFASVSYIPFQIRKVSWRVFVPAIINSITFLVVYCFYGTLGDLRINLGFRINENSYIQVVQWVEQSLSNGGILLNDGKEEVVFLPKVFHGLSEDNRIYVTKYQEDITIFFYRGGGLFEYSPGFTYRSDNNFPADNGDIVCYRQIKPHWYACS